MTKIIEFINKKMAQLVKRDSTTYEAILGKAVYTENVPIQSSVDYNCGAIANEFELLRAFINQLISYFDTDMAEGMYLEILVDFLLALERIFDETNVNLRNRLNAYLRRNDNPRWMTIWSMIDIFSYFFNKANIYYEENYIETDLILNGGFEDYSPPNFSNWTKSESGTSTITQETGTGNMFQDLACAKYAVDSSNSTVYLTQTKNSVVAGDYKVGFWYKSDGNCPADNVVKISMQRSSDSKYYQWDGTWDTGEAFKEFVKSSTDWKLAYAYIDNEGTENLTLKVQNAGSSGTAYNFYVDRCMLGLWKTYPSFKLLLIFSMQQGAYSILWDSEDGHDNLIDRGECESTTSPMIFDETVPYLQNALWARDSAEHYFGSYSYKFTKNNAAGGEAFVSLVDNILTTDMHGLAAGKEYSFIVRIKIPSGGILGSEVYLQLYDYASGAWQPTQQHCALIYDAWQYIKVKRTIRASATGTLIRIYAASSSALNEYFHVDDIRFAEGDVGDIELAAFIGQDFIMGAGGGYTSDYYIDLLNKAKPAGVKSAVENIGRNV